MSVPESRYRRQRKREKDQQRPSTARPAPLESLALILRSVGDGVHGLDAKGRITFVNPAAARMLGWKPEDLLGRSQHATIHHTRADGRIYAAADCPILAATRGGRARRRTDEVFWRKDGTSFPVDYVATPLRVGGRVTGAVVAFRDVTEWREASAQLETAREARAHEERVSRDLQRIFMQVPAAVCTTRGGEHVIESANVVYRQLAGHRDLIGKTMRAAFPEMEGQGFFEIMDRVYLTGEPAGGHEVPVIWDRGGAKEEGFADFVYQPLRDANDEVCGLMLHAVDVTESTRARHQVEESAAELRRVTQSLARINRELDQFAYVASHDLKAPLRGIASLAQWIEEDIGDRLGEESQKHLGLLQARVHRMEALIDGLLQYSRAGRVRNKIENVDVRKLLGEVVEMLDPPREATIEFEPGMPALETERVPLQHVFLNLIGNAVKHSGRPDTRVSVRFRDIGDFYEFSVSDNGPGIPRQFHEKVWDVFQTLQSRDKVEGAGLGLALVKKNVEGRGGRAWLESEERAGATFFFQWPKQTPQEG
jgi:PAS domain S-box-containing protein